MAIHPSTTNQPVPFFPFVFPFLSTNVPFVTLAVSFNQLLLFFETSFCINFPPLLSILPSGSFFAARVLLRGMTLLTIW